MDYFDMLIQQRIDSETADLVDALLEQELPSLQPCDCPLHTVLSQLAEKYPLTILPKESTHYAQTALAVIESDFPEDADYLPHDWEERLEQTLGLTETLHMQLFCAEVRDEGAGHALYEQQRIQYEQRTAGSGQVWRRMPVRICAETNSGYCLVTGSEPLREELLVMRGISQDDIDHKTPTLIAYLRARHALRDLLEK
ncbi:hypothetical protein [Butyricicoccus sp.]|uniref:hypothetical protein n=1 Tax=Butyricicoccus sp. TaxID=2049021 RepID=UPI003D7D13CA